MAITIDYSDRITPQYVIQIPRADMTLVQSTPTEIRELNINAFRTELMDLQDDQQNIWAPITHVHTAPLAVAGVTLARVVEILDPYVIEFEDGQYNVNIVGGNSNISDVTLKNQVGLNTANSAGLQDPFALQAAAFGPAFVVIDQANGLPGTTFPRGTRGFPVNNLDDALTIANQRGIKTLEIVGTYVFQPTDVLDDFIVEGISATKSTCVLTGAATITNCVFRQMTITGQLDGGNDASFCVIAGLDYIDGSLLDCFLAPGDIVLNGAQANFLRCASAVAGGGPGQTPTIDMGGTGTDVVIRDYQGGIELKNHTSGVDNVSIDMSSGRVVFDSTISSGVYTVRGIADIEDNSTGTAVINDLTLNRTNVASAVWDDLTSDHQVADTFGEIVQETKIAADRAGTQRIQ